MKKHQNKLEKFFVKNGYIKFKINNKIINFLRKKIIIFTKEITGLRKIDLNKFHELYEIGKLNNLRIKLYNKINTDKQFSKKIFESSFKHIELMVGSELCNGNLNLSIQYPNDKTSILSMHTDFFSGESIFQVNLWIPFVDVKKTSSMFIINPQKSINLLKKIKESKKFTINNIFKKNKKDIKWLDIKFGEGMIFSPNCLHGNVMNIEKNTRWSINIRFKNLFSPYSKIKENEKKIGSFYNVYSPKIITQFNLEHSFDEIIA
jgi:sporadic carbohydrate cluster 2OG-Fe(II) oxygenase